MSDFCFQSMQRWSILIRFFKENSGRFPFNKNSGLKFRKFHVPNGTVQYYVPSSCTDPIQATACLLTVLVNRIQKSGSGDNNFVKWKRDISVQLTKTTRPVKEDHLQSCSWIFWSNQCKQNCSIPFDVPTEMYGILGWMESTLRFPFDLFNTSWTPGYAPVKR